MATWAAALLLLGMLFPLAVLAATSLGAVQVSPAETIAVFAHHVHLPGGIEAGSAADRIIWDIRLPRVLTAGVVGAALAAAGVGYQGVFRNPLADPYLLGVASGAGLGGTIAIVSPLPLDFYGFGFVALFSFIGAVLAVAATYEMARTGRTVPASMHVLAGIAVSSMAAAATSFLMMMNEERISLVFAWLYGDFTTSSWHKLWLIAPYVAASLVVLQLLSRQLNLLQLGDDEVRTLGMRVEAVKVAVIVVASLATAVCVAVSGLIGFVGLIVPHACRMMVGPDHRILLPVSILFGATFLVLVDLGSRTILAPQEIPAGILTAALGGPFFLFLLRTRRRMVAG